MQRTRRPMQVRLCAYPAYWLKEYESFANKALRELVWSTGAGVRPGDVQIFCVDDNLDRAEELADDPQVGAVHSLWQATTRALSSLGNREFPVQAKFEVLVRLDNPVPKADLARESLLATRLQKWPQNQKGIIFRTPERVLRFAALAYRYNPHQQECICRALGVAV